MIFDFGERKALLDRSVRRDRPGVAYRANEHRLSDEREVDELGDFAGAVHVSDVDVRQDDRGARPRDRATEHQSCYDRSHGVRFAATWRTLPPERGNQQTWEPIERHGPA